MRRDIFRPASLLAEPETFDNERFNAMVDSALTMTFNWDPSKEIIFPEKTTKDEFDEAQRALNCDDALKTEPPSIKSLQQDQNALIQQRIYDRTLGLRGMPSLYQPWFQQQIGTQHQQQQQQQRFPSLELNIQPTLMGQQMDMFNRPLVSKQQQTTNVDVWVEYAQDPAMRSRPCFSSQQTCELEREFTLCQYITRRRRIELAYNLNLSEKQIKTWFQNRRVKERKKKKNNGDNVKKEPFENSEGIV